MALRWGLGLVLVGVLAMPAHASGPFLPETVFVTTVGVDPRHPTDFYEGKLGVLTPEFSGRRMAAAYRALIGKPLSPAQAKVVAEWSPEQPSAYDVVGSWQEARNGLVPHLPRKSREDFGTDWSGDSAWILNCSSDAVATATATLKTRIAQHGARNPYIANWVAGQDEVFIACGTGKGAPPELAADAPVWLKQDRAYQTAAAQFYRGAFEPAAASFRAIAADKTSPWSDSGLYLAARSLHRQALQSLSAPETESRSLAPAFQPAMELAHRVIADPALIKWHEAARDILRQAEFRFDRIAMARTVEARFLETADPGMLGSALNDYMIAREALDDLPMGQWIRTMRGNRETKVFAQWQKEKSLPWLVAAAAQRDLEPQQAQQIIDATTAIDSSSPAYAHLSYFRILLLLEQNKKDVARKALDDVDLTAPSINLQARNLFRSLKLRLARTMVEFVQAAPREIAYFYNTPREDERIAAPPFTVAEMKGSLVWAWRWELYGKEARYFDIDAVSVINRFLPLDRTVQMLRQNSWPQSMHSQLVLLAFARAIALQRYEVAQSLSGDLAAIVPEHRALFDAFAAAGDVEARRFLGAMALLRLPGASVVLDPATGYLYRPHVIGNYGLRWWDKATNEAALSTASDQPRWIGRYPHQCAYLCEIPLKADKPPPFIDAATAERAARENAVLVALPSPPDLLGREILRHAARHPNDAMLPEALHLVVRATRYSTSETDISREAWSLLHRRFPGDAWTKRTPFYF